MGGRQTLTRRSCGTGVRVAVVYRPPEISPAGGVDPNSSWFALAMLVLLGLVARLMVYLTLVFKDRRRRR